MSEARIGRLVVASLHHAISEMLPLRIEFYENWLKPLGLLKEGRVIGAASFLAALSFLRREEPPTIYRQVTRRAGILAAEWTVAHRSWARRRWLRMMPPRARARAALRQARDVARVAYPGSRVRFRIQRDRASLDVRGSIFCQVREPADGPLCGFYEGLTLRLLEANGIVADLTITRCRAAGGSGCHMELLWQPAADAPAKVGVLLR
jgi:hypothetical protein